MNNYRMKYGIICALIFSASIASARIGETLEQCTARYGEPLTCIGEMVLFRKNGLDTTVFFSQGKVECVAFRKVETDVAGRRIEIPGGERAVLLSENSSGWTISAPNIWVSGDGLLFAIKNPENALIIGTGEFINRINGKPGLMNLSYGQDDLSALRKKAEQGSAEAQCNLGRAYVLGKGVPQNYTEAVKWYRLAAEQGHADAQYFMGLAYSNGEEVTRDYKEAAKWWELAAEQGISKAQFNLGVAYDSGKGVPQDYKEAVRWFRPSAEQGYAKAQYNLGVAYDKGKGVPQDYKEAVKWYRLAAEKGIAEAQFNLGVVYYNGQGVQQDLAQAYAWVNLAVAQEYKNAKDARSIILNEMTPALIKVGRQLSREYAAKFGAN